MFSGKAIVVSEYSDLFVRSVSCTFPLPSVIALRTYQKCPNQVPVMSRRNVYIRDGFKCQVRGADTSDHLQHQLDYQYMRI